MKKRIVSLFLTVMLLLGMIPTVALPQAEAAQTSSESVMIDFKQSAIDASKQDFWADLKDSTGTAGGKYTTKVMGYQGRVGMDAAQKAAYFSLLDYLWENHGWTIVEETSFLTTYQVNKAVWFNANEMPEDSDWGMTYQSGGFNTAADLKANGSRLNLSVHVEQAGYYAVDVTAYYSSNTGNLAQYTACGNIAVGGAYADVLVNGVSVLPEGMTSYAFSGHGDHAAWINTTQTDRLGYAYFNEGTNNITFNTTGNFQNVTNSAAMRRNISLKSVELKYVGDEECTCDEFTYVVIEPGLHKAICVNCEAETEENCVDENSDRICDLCGGKAVPDAFKMSVSVPGVVKQVARNTVQNFTYDIVSDNGITFDDLTIRYETDTDGIIEIDEDDHTFHTLKNGDVTVTITASIGIDEVETTLDLTVADVGESCFLNTDPTFEKAGTIDHWATYPNYGNKLFNFTTVEDDGTGNKALKLTTNSNTSYGAGTIGSVIVMNNGYLAKLYPGHMYEMSARVKVGEYKKPEGATGDMGIGFQMFDYKTNATSSYLGKINGNCGGISLDTTEWTEVRFVVKVPLDTAEPVYVTPRIVFRPNDTTADKNVTGWEASVWFDDFCIREVGFEGVEFEVDGSLRDTRNAAKVIIKPYTTSGDYIDIPAASYADMLSFSCADESVAKIESAPVRTRYTTTSQEYFPVAKVKRLDSKRETELTADVTIYGITRTGTLDVKTVNPADIVLASMDVTIPGVTKQVARNTVQDFNFEILDVEGAPIMPEEVQISCETDVEGMIEFNEEDCSFRTLQNGDVTLTVTVSLNGKSLSKTFDLTIADVGENRFIYTDPTFESEGLEAHWATYANYGDKRFNITTVEDDGTGNHALRIRTNPNVSMTDVGNLASVITMANGYFAEVLPGHMYEMKFKVKTTDYKKPEDATSDLAFDCQMFDYANSNSQTAANLLLKINGIQNGIDLNIGEWTELTYVVKAPLEADGPVYIMPRVVLRPQEADYDVPGWEFSAWFDDFSIREVGFERVEVEFDSELKDTTTPANIFIKSYATNGGNIDIAADDVAKIVTVTSTNEDVVTVTKIPERLVYNSANREYHPKAELRLVGLNAPAELVVNVNIHGVNREVRLDMTRTDMKEVLRDVYYTLDGFEALVLKNGETAKGALAGRTTQLNNLTEDQLREGSVYFTSSNTKVAVVDHVSGDVTCVGEGTAIISAYVLKDGVTASDSVELTVTDDTDLVSIQIAAATNYVGVNNTVQLSLTGQKASGGVADMNKYPIAWSVDDESLATVSDDGRLTGLKAGTVNVTATVGVMRTAISDTITIKIVPNSELAGADLLLDFTDGRLMNIQDCTLEKDGVQINYAETYNEGVDAKTIHKYGFGFNVPEGEQLAIDFVLPKSGWYRVEAGGGLFSSGNISDIYVDNYYAGNIDFFAGISGQPYAAKMVGNTIYLEAGQHTFYVVAQTKGLQFLGKLILRATADPMPVSVEVSTAKDSILVGESTELVVKGIDANGMSFYFKALEEISNKENYYVAEAITSEATVSGSTVTGAAPGTALVNVATFINGTTGYYDVELSVSEGTIASAELTAEKTTFTPNGGSEALKIVCYNIAGKKMETPDNVSVTYTSSDPEIASVSADGTVTAGSKEGSAKITATIIEGSRVIETKLWITITTGKSEPTLYTYEERANAKENIQKYSWAWDTKESAVRAADFVIANFDAYYQGLGREGGIPRTSAMYREGYNGVKNCDYCGTAIESIFGVNCWIVDPVNKPWKVTCPYCKKDFPSNDFGAYYASGLDERGYFHEELADKSLLVNTTFPDKPADWGVDDGNGWLTGDKDSGGVEDTYNYIAYYSHMRFAPRGKATNGLLDGIEDLAEAYLYTGDEKYGTYGAILLIRVAEIYPEYSMKESSPSGLYVNSDGGSGLGKFVGAIWESTMVGQKLAKASDALWPAMNNDAVMEYLKNDNVFYGVDPEVFTPEYLREKVDSGILLQIRDAVLSTNAAGNFGMEQGAMATAAVALDRLPETEEMLDWTFRYGQRLSSPTTHATGGNVYYNVVNLVDRNGFGNEVSYTYNRQWYTNLMGVADALAGYDRVEGADLWKFPKFVDMLRAYGRLVQGGYAVVQFGEAGAVQSATTILNLDVSSYSIPAFQNTGDPFLAQMIYAGNGNSVDGLHADIFSKDPEGGFRAKIKAAILEHGELDMSASSQLAGYGVTNLRTGPAKYLGKNINGDEFFNTSMFYGSTDASHGHLEALSLNLFAHGLSMSANLGYPTVVSSSDFSRTQFIRNTISHNTVVVDDQAQLGLTYGGFPLHYDDADRVQLVDVEASNAYAMTDIYRRTVVTVKAPNGVPYNVDFFRVLGGKEHVYSFHANTTMEPTTEGLDFIYQPMGSYAGPDVPYGPQYFHPTSTDGPYNQGHGYSWLKEVYRDASPDANFTIDWTIEDFHNQLASSKGLHMKLTMHSDAPMTEVALADGIPPQNGSNPEKLKYVLVRRSGEAGMDTLFTSVIETYHVSDQIASSELVDVALVEGTETITDKAAAIKVTMNDGRVDYIVYATNSKCLYNVDGKFDFCGFVGVCSYYDDTLVYAYGNDAKQVANVIENETPVVTGKVLSFTEGLSLEGYTITVSPDQGVTEADLEGRCVYVDNDKQRNAVYQIVSADVDGDTAVLHVGHETLVRGYLDGNDLDAGFTYNIAVGAGFSIPLSSTFDTASIFGHTADIIVKAGNKLSQTTGVANSGCTYAADGLVSGMKLDSKTGLLTWTTSKTQTGRYPITIKAMDDSGDVIATMSFVIYAVSYTGSTYAPDVCTHSKTVTYEVDGMIETICPACGTITKKDADAQITKFNVAGANMTLGNELKLNIMVKTADLGKGTYTAKITHNGKQTEAVFTKYNSNYYFVSCAVAAKQMADVITVEVFDENGNAVSNIYKTSVRTYAMNALDNSSMGAKVKTLVVDMLNYGTEAQIYFKYNETDLANSLLTSVQRALATKNVTCTNRQVKGENFYGANLSLEDRILLNLFFKNVGKDYTAEITFTDFRGEQKTVKKALVPYTGSIYKIVVDDIVLADAFTDVTATVYDGDGNICGTCTDSVESYVARSDNSALSESIIKFAYSAREYLS